MASRDALVLWEQGKYLHDILGYGNENIEGIMQSAMEIARDDLDDARLFLNSFMPQDKLDNALEIIDFLERKNYAQQMVAAVNFFDLLREMVKEHHRLEILEGRKIGIGYLQPRQLEDYPKPIPIDFWEGSVDWANSTVSSGWQTFHSVRLVKKPDVMPTSRKQVGRPSRKQLILEAFHYGVEQKLIDLSHSKTSIYKKVREIIQTHFLSEVGDGRGLGESPMKKHLSELIDQERLCFTR